MVILELYKAIEIMKKLLILLVLTLATGCMAGYKASCFYGEPNYLLKEKQMVINTEQAAQLFAKHYFIDHPEVKEVTAYIDVLFRGKYIVSPYQLRYDAKFGRYWLSRDTYWVNGKKATVKKKKHRYVLRILKLVRNEEGELRRQRLIIPFSKKFERDSILP